MKTETAPDTIKLLLVDDELDFLDTVAERLHQRGFEVVKASNGPAAIEAANQGGFDLALVDLKMPGMDGIELLQILRNNHKYLEVVILTGFGSIDSAVECTKRGAFGYLSKPCDLDQLLEKLKDAYAARLKKKFLDDESRVQTIRRIEAEADPMSLWHDAQEQMKSHTSLLSALRDLRKLDNKEK